MSYYPLYTIDSYTGAVGSEEICNAVSAGELAMMDSVIKKATRDLYALGKSDCSKPALPDLCLFFYTYALGTWCSVGPNYMSEPQLRALLACTERTTKICCNG